MNGRRRPKGGQDGGDGRAPRLGGRSNLLAGSEYGKPSVTPFLGKVSAPMRASHIVLPSHD